MHLMCYTYPMGTAASIAQAQQVASNTHHGWEQAVPPPPPGSQVVVLWMTVCNSI